MQKWRKVKIINQNCISSKSSWTVKSWLDFQWIYRFLADLNNDLKLENNLGKFETFTRKHFEFLFQSFLLLDLLTSKCYEDVNL